MVIETTHHQPETIFPKERPSLTDADVMTEIPSLRLVKKGQEVRMRIRNGNFAWVLLKEDAILKIKTLENHIRRFSYTTRVSVEIEEYTSSGGIMRTIEEGVTVDVRRKQRIIPPKLIPEIIQRIRNYTKPS